MAQAVDRALARLIARGVLSAAQAEAVRDELAAEGAELTVAEVTPAGAGQPAGVGKHDRAGIRPAAEIAAWVGAVLAVAAGLTAAARFWAQLTVWAQSALLLVAALALFAAGAWIVRDERPAVRRILSVSWFLSISALGAAVVLAANDGMPTPRAAPWLAAGLVCAAAAYPLWRRAEGSLQLLALVASAVAALLSALGLAERPPVDLYGLLVWAGGAALLLLGWGGLARPVPTALTAGGLGTLAGAEALYVAYPRTGVSLGLATVAGLFVLGAVVRRVALTGLAAAALAVFVPEALDAFFPGSLNASATLFVSGAVLLAGALAAIRRARADEDPAPDAAAETTVPETTPADQGQEAP